MESGQHVSGPVVRTIQGHRVGLAEIVGLIVVEVDVSSCIWTSGSVSPLYRDLHDLQRIRADLPELNGIHWCRVCNVSASELNMPSFR